MIRAIAIGLCLAGLCAAPALTQDEADLVLFDPVGTGWLQAMGKTDVTEEFWGMHEDAASIEQLAQDVRDFIE